MKHGKFNLCSLLALLVTLPSHHLAQSRTNSQRIVVAERLTIAGAVLKASGKPVAKASVSLHSSTGALLGVIASARGQFSFHDLLAGSYTISAEDHGLHSMPVNIRPSLKGAYIRLVLSAARTDKISTANGQGIAFSDEPSFIVSGVTDWTAVGGHGSDATLRTSEDLARATAILKGDTSTPLPGKLAASSRLQDSAETSPRSPEANLALGEFYIRSKSYQQALGPLQIAAADEKHAAAAEYNLALVCRALNDLPQAQLHVERALTRKDTAVYQRLAGEISEQQADPLSAVQHLAHAVRLEPSEENYFAWGSELLSHRAVMQAAEVFRHGTESYPASARMQTGWGSALFAEAHYQEASERLCKASDLQVSATEPYFLLGKVDESAPEALPCIGQRLESFLRLAPQNADASYLYAMYLLRHHPNQSPERPETLLRQAVTLTPTHAPALLQLGILAANHKDFAKAVDYYKQAISADSRLAEAHYRVANVYEHIGQSEQASAERALHRSIKQQEAEAIEQERKSIKQFLIILQQPAPER